ncbi:MAG: septum formation protein Maf [Alphaproteobacteria bacterium]|nr:septum formation protein Maf [Alphaproteobacteria bacterium]
MTALILASASRVRAGLLEQAGVPFRARPADVDEAATKSAMAGSDPMTIAAALAELKARTVAHAHPDALVLGADQVLVCEGVAFDKPRDMDEARSHLRRLRGRTHHLCTAAAAVGEGTVLWRHQEQPALAMRSFDDRFIDAYLAGVGEDALLSVGAYQLEGRGAQLFERVDGDFFSILGLPLLPLLAFLRRRNVIEA